jgi:hypothetical protein
MTIEFIVVAGSLAGAAMSLSALIVSHLDRRRAASTSEWEANLNRIEELSARLDRSGLPSDHLDDLHRTIGRLKRDVRQLQHRPQSGIGTPPPAPS